MHGDYSWNRSAHEYLKLYESLFSKKPPEEEKENEPNPVVVDI
jgi:starch synthase